jgi:hypothetical protein
LYVDLDEHFSFWAGFHLRISSCWDWCTCKEK